MSTELVPRGLPESLSHLFAPISTETLADLFQEYASTRRDMESLAEMVAPHNGIISYFISANAPHPISSEVLFNLPKALSKLDATFWDRALRLTDVLDIMPQERREDWFTRIVACDTPPFEPTTVHHTLQDLLAARALFFAERVDGIFKALSHTHVTNRPEGFSGRMILNYVYSYGSVNCNRCDTIHDLRCVVAKFMGDTEDPLRTATREILNHALKVHGEWVSMDGGTIRVRAYKKGTAHLEVAPEMAMRLNSVLAYLYPATIPDFHRVPPKERSHRSYKPFAHIIPHAVRNLLAEGYIYPETQFQFRFDSAGKLAFKASCAVLEALGGVATSPGTYQFDYDIRTLLKTVLSTGEIPDQYSHQYYPTPSHLAQLANQLAGIQPHHTILEPSAGQGHLALYLPKTLQTTLVEISPTHCEILRSKGFPSVIEEDFLAWKPSQRFDRIVMNPPFTKGQWVRHLEHAASLLASGGKIIALLPSGAANHLRLPGFTAVFSEPHPFPGTSIEVIIATVERTQ